MNMQKLSARGLMTAALLLMTAIVGCEDAPPTDYVPQYIVEGYIFVGQPIEGIRIGISQSVTDTFRYDKGIVSDADVRITAGGRTLPLQFRKGDGTEGGDYYYPDTSERVKENTLYTIEVRTKDGGMMTAQTLTPGQVAWVKPPVDTLRYPIDTLTLPSPDSLKLSWTAVPDISEYLISVRCLDTAGYGKYLRPPTAEKNRRIVRKFDENDPQYDDVSRWGFIPANESKVVWPAFKWFGPQEVTIYAPERAFVNWFKLTHFGGNGQYDPLLGNVKGGLGVFTSASVATKRVFLLKNQP